MAVVQTLIGNVKGPAGATGATGATGDPGQAATITVGSTTTTAYGNAASVTNSGTSSAAVFDFVIPQGKPGEATTKMGDLLLDSITSSAADFPSPQVGDTGKTAFGKIVKFFSDTIAKFTQHESDMATISTSPTTRAFSTGEYLVYNSQLYRVTSNIANGGNLVIGNNITATSAGTQLKSLNDSLTVTAITSTAQTNVTISSGVAYKLSDIVICNYGITTSSSLSTNYNLIYLADAHPSATRYLIARKDNSAYPCYINASGYIKNGGAWPAGDYVITGVYVI